MLRVSAFVLCLFIGILLLYFCVVFVYSKPVGKILTNYIDGLKKQFTTEEKKKKRRKSKK